MSQTVALKCIRCQKTESEDWYDAKYFTKDLTSENIAHSLEDDLCLECGRRYCDIQHAEIVAMIAKGQLRVCPPYVKLS
jgi:hypothetical protein